MGITLAHVKKALDANDFSYRELDTDVIGTGITLDSCRLTMTISLLEKGEYIRFRTLQFNTCQESHPAFEEVLRVLTKANYQYKLAKFGWDKKDGEIVGEADLPIEDNSALPPDQLFGMLSLFCNVVDEVNKEIERALASCGTTSEDRRPVKPTKSSPVPDSPGNEAVLHRRSSSNPSARNPIGLILAVGVLLLGAAAVLGAIYLFVH